MKDFAALRGFFGKNPITAATTLAGALVGAILGVLAYYNGWLG